MEENKKQEEIINHDLTLLAKSSIFVFIGIFLSKVFMYLYRIVIARYYGPEIYGLFSIALMVMGFFLAFASLGFSSGLARFIPLYRGKKEKEKIKYLISLSKKVLFFSAIFSAILLYFSSEFIAIKIFHNLELAFYLKLFSFLIPIQIFTDIYFGIIRSYERIKAYTFGVNIIQNIIKFIFVILFIYLGLKSYNAISFPYFLGVFSGLIFAYLYCRIKLPYIFLKSKLSHKERFDLRKSLFSYSWPLILLAMAGTLMFWLDTFLIGYFQGAYWVGIYNAAIPIAVLLLFASEIFMLMFFPLITRKLASKNIVIVKELSKQIVKWIFIINLPIAILMFLFPGAFINLFFGKEYLFASNALRLLVIAQFIFSLSAVSGSLLLSKGKSKIFLINIIFTAIINFILNFNLIPKYGINGAALATFISMIILSLLVIIENYHFNSILPFRRKMISIFFISLIPSGILYWISRFININLIWLIIFGISFLIIYFGLIILTKSFDKNDLMILRKVFRR